MNDIRGMLKSNAVVIIQGRRRICDQNEYRNDSGPGGNFKIAFPCVAMTGLEIGSWKISIHLCYYSDFEDE